MIDNSTGQENQVKSAAPTKICQNIVFCDTDRTADLFTELVRREPIYYFKSKNSENKSFLAGMLSAKGYTSEFVENGIIAVRNDLIAFGFSGKEILDIISWPSKTSDAVRISQLLESEIRKKKKSSSSLITRQDEIEIVSEFF